MIDDLDRDRLWQALGLAETAIGVSDPNPRVGCVIGRTDGTLLGAGATQRAGQAHAEIVALREAAAAGQQVRGATAWVTLEPCAHHGRTPPCVDALLAAGLARVVVAMRDPYPQVDGAGIARLRAAGVVVDVVGETPGAAPQAGAARPAAALGHALAGREGAGSPPAVADADRAIAAAALALNIGFVTRVTRGTPWVRLKAAVSLDGRTALPDGRSQWITGAAARADGHAWRRRAGAVLTGVGTLLADDPRLDVRLVPTALQPRRVIVDSRLRTPPGARALAPPGEVLMATASTDADATAALQRAGAEVIVLPRGGGGPGAGHGAGGVSLPRLLEHLGRSGVNELHVEAGPTLNAALLQAGLVDEILLYMAPVLLGPGLPLAALAVLPSLQAAPRYAIHDMARVGQDLRLRLLAQVTGTGHDGDGP